MLAGVGEVAAEVWNVSEAQQTDMHDMTRVEHDDTLCSVFHDPLITEGHNTVTRTNYGV